MFDVERSMFDVRIERTSTPSPPAEKFDTGFTHRQNTSGEVLCLALNFICD
jgi:hypothetical protein